jgi:hypothetical protein
MNLCGVARPLRLEQLARSLTGKRSDEGAQRLVTLCVDLALRVRASVRSMLSPPLAPMPSSFGHDTPAHVERRFRFRVLVLQWMAALSAAPMHRRLTGDLPWQRDDVDSEERTDLALWSEAEAQSDPIAGSADESSPESATKE